MRHSAGKTPRCRWRKLYMCEQTIHTNKKLKFLTTKTSQKTQVYICSCILTRHSVLACFVFAILKQFSWEMQTTPAEWVSPTMAIGCRYAHENIRTVPFGRLCITTKTDHLQAADCIIIVLLTTDISSLMYRYLLPVHTLFCTRTPNWQTAPNESKSS